jgi:fused signal recognition particle receptor
MVYPTAIDKIRNSLSKTRETFHRALQLFECAVSKDFDHVRDEMEALLLSADVGITATNEIIRHLHERRAEYDPSRAAIPLIASILNDILSSVPEVHDNHSPPLTILMVGVNGTGKTTSIAKLAKRYRNEGERVLLVASDTYRPAGIEQLCVWGERVDVTVHKSQLGQDPASVAYDALSSAFSRDFSVVIIDTAGRLHTNQNLLKELQKISSVLTKKRADLPQETYLVLDATTGQNGLSQARIFSDTIPISGVILTKVDGTAKGGIVFAIAMELGIPVRYIGIGETGDDLLPFERQVFISSILQNGTKP